LSIDTFLTSIINKKDELDNPHIIKSKSDNYLQIYKNHFHIFTDGSKFENNDTGFGVYIPKPLTQISTSLHPTHTIFQAELIAIYQALYFMDTYTSNNIPSHYSIFSDSSSVLKALKNFSNHTHNIHIEKILELHTKLHKKNLNISLFWIPSHCDIKGNEEADKLAKLGANKTNDHNTPYIALKYIYNILDQKILEKWQTLYTQSNIAIHYKNIVPLVSYNIKMSTNNKHKFHIFTKLRSGIIGLNKRLFQYKKNNSNSCNICTNTPETKTLLILPI